MMLGDLLLCVHKISVSIEIYRLSFYMLFHFICAFHPETFSFHGYEISLFIPFFVLSVLQYFPISHYLNR
jgi:hypothetical protein